MGGLLPVEDALERLLEGAAPSATEQVEIGRAAGRILAAPIVALRTQPPFDASAMDGYAVRGADIATLPVRLAVTGVAAAGHGFAGSVRPLEAVRIFTGAPVPEGADTVVIQENAERLDEQTVEIREPTMAGRNIRRAGLDFREGEPLLETGRSLDPAALSLAAAANHATLSVWKRPLVAILATGDELLPPGSAPGPDQIIASNTYGVAAIAASAGADVVDLGIVPDRADIMAEAVRRAADAGADVLVTLGGASVGDHDLVQQVLTGLGLDLAFWKIAMRPGKPLMFGRLGGMRCLGLPGNPVSSLVCAHLFLKPLVRRLAGHQDASGELLSAVLGADMPANDTRQDYVRASLQTSGGRLVATPLPVQDSSMLKTMAMADCLIVRAPFAAAAAQGEPCRIILLR